MSRTLDNAAAPVARYATAIYLLAVLMLFMPPLDVILSLQQYAWGSARWRFGVVGLLSGAMLLPIMGLLLASLTASYARHRVVQRLVIGVGAVVALGLVVAMLMFSLDAIEVRRNATADFVRRYDLTVVKTLLMQLVQLLALAMIARSAWRSVRSLGESRSAREPELVAGALAR